MTNNETLTLLELSTKVASTASAFVPAVMSMIFGLASGFRSRFWKIARLYQYNPLTSWRCRIAMNIWLPDFTTHLWSGRGDDGSGIAHCFNDFASTEQLRLTIESATLIGSVENLEAKQ